MPEPKGFNSYHQSHITDHIPQPKQRKKTLRELLSPWVIVFTAVAIIGLITKRIGGF